MKPLKPQAGLTEQVHQALLDAMADGSLGPGTHLVQEELAAKLGVSRQPVQQALALLKSEGLVRESGKRGLYVAPLEPAAMRQHYDVRAALDGLAARLAAERARTSRDTATAIKQQGAVLIAGGRLAMDNGSIPAMVKCDISFHEFVYEMSGNPLIAQSAALHWRQLRRVMGEVLRHAAQPASIWRQHRDILDAIVAGDAPRAEREAIAHVWSAAERLQHALSIAGGAGGASETAARKPVRPRRNS